ncbi:MAG: hypothetical protein BAJALOKI3v1_1170003 [Promethearchaeota archaeon]|nr:MAG: hypothetical protein BAJALOKI3v1_1170003 [Candidatus Lokiarchaeota archaeon]
MKEFKINEYLKLKLEDDETLIYINGEQFAHCKYLLLNIPVNDLQLVEDLDSIDEIKDKLDHSLEPEVDLQGNLRRENMIDPQTEFLGHCSNLQAWYENNYDTRLLDSKLSFPLLRKLSVVGDKLAERMYKQEMLKRIESGYTPVILLLIAEGYLEDLEKEEYETIAKTIEEKMLQKNAAIGGEILKLFYILSEKEEKVKKLKTKLSKKDWKPENAKSWEMLANMYYNLDKYDDAIEIYNTLLEQDKNDPHFYISLAKSFFQIDEIKRAERYVKIAIELDENSAYSHYLYGHIIISDEKYERAIDELNTALELDQDLLKAKEDLAFIYAERGETKRAIEEYEKLREKGIENKYLLDSLAYLYFENQQYQKAMEIFEIIDQKYPNIEEYMIKLGECYFNTKNYRKAITILQKARNLYPKNPTIRFLTGHTLISLDKFSEAKNELNITLQFYPEFHQAREDLVYIYSEESNFSKAIEEYEILKDYGYQTDTLKQNMEVTYAEMRDQINQE